MPPTSLLHRRPGLRLVKFVAALALLFVGCAKYPNATTVVGVRRLIFSMTVAGTVNPNYVYIVALRPTNVINPTDSGPIPVIAPPWGNGFVAGNCSYFVRWDPTTSPAYTIYQFQDALLTQYFPIGVPVFYQDVQANGKTITFDLDLTQIAPDLATAHGYQSIQVNFLTMDRVPQGATGTKTWDALGNSQDVSQINTWITIPLNTTGLYNNAFYNNIEPTGDCPLPDIDISDFSVQVLNPAG